MNRDGILILFVSIIFITSILRLPSRQPEPIFRLADVYFGCLRQMDLWSTLIFYVVKFFVVENDDLFVNKAKKKTLCCPQLATLIRYQNKKIMVGKCCPGWAFLEKMVKKVPKFCTYGCFLKH